jgi:hypothetical protein
MIERMIEETEGIAGFRLFPGHDPRALEHCLPTRRCAKVVLARNPVDSYVSLKIARKTGQWWLGDHDARKPPRRVSIPWSSTVSSAPAGLLRACPPNPADGGQTAFHIHYDDLAILPCSTGSPGG